MSKPRKGKNGNGKVNGSGNAEQMAKPAKKNWPGPNKNHSNLKINIFIPLQEICSKNVAYSLLNQNLWPALFVMVFITVPNEISEKIWGLSSMLTKP